MESFIINNVGITVCILLLNAWLAPKVRSIYILIKHITKPKYDHTAEIKAMIATYKRQMKSNKK